MAKELQLCRFMDFDARTFDMRAEAEGNNCKSISSTGSVRQLEMSMPLVRLTFAVRNNGPCTATPLCGDAYTA